MQCGALSCQLMINVKKLFSRLGFMSAIFYSPKQPIKQKTNHGQSLLKKSKNAGIYFVPDSRNTYLAPLQKKLKVFIYRQLSLKPKQHQWS
jgi:hypothetical protein